jgi:hypothetical protein
VARGAAPPSSIRVNAGVLRSRRRRTSVQAHRHDLRSDPGERRDVAQSRIALWQELRGLVDKWEADVNSEATQRAMRTTSSVP